ncbi:spore gernimation protein [Paenibacillus nanensis]|uniref:Spore gernimation protein n=1 Tax=Paenibacillus nanensis TaxID=393251 RepID=A0A3A1V0K8_9BACL|nr:endospore germination permease [Paenibacillus nanensis]RIX52972.1 spore gernimation protein [Paenibacillus nanensis]
MKVKITNGMFVALIMTIIYAKAIGVTQGSLAREIGHDMWIATILGTLQGIVMMILTAAILQKLPDQNFIGFAEALLGKWAGKIVAFVIFLFFLFSFGPIMVTFIYHFKDYFLPEAPIYLFIVVALIVGIFGGFHGLEVMARMALVGAFAVVCLNILLLTGSLSEFDIHNLRPVMEKGFIQTSWASRHYDTDWALATVMAGMILPMVKQSEKWVKAGWSGMILTCIAITMWPILEAAVLSAPVTAEYIVSCMHLARGAHIGIFLHRYELIMIALFSTSSLIQIMMSLYCSAHALSKIFGVKDYRPMLIPAGLALGAFGYWLVLDHLRAISFTEKEWPLISLPIAFLLPIILWTFGKLFRRKLSRS